MEGIKTLTKSATATVSGAPSANIARFLTIQASRNGGGLLMQAHAKVETTPNGNIARFLDIQATRNGGGLLMQAHSAN